MTDRSVLAQLLFAIMLTSAGLVQAKESLPDVAQIQQAELLIESGNSADAYALLQPLELEHAGNIRYDYLLGISALNSGKASQAVFALERVQEIDPTYGDVGLWLAIAYLRSGDRERARTGLLSVLATSRNSSSRSRASEYLASIKQLEAREGAGNGDASSLLLLGKVEAGLGYDSNIANFPSSSQNSVQPSNTYAAPTSNLAGMESILNLGIEGRYPISGNYAFVSVDDGRRIFHDHGIMNSETIITKAGLNFTNDVGDAYRVNLSKRMFIQEGSIETIQDPENDYVINGLEGSSRFKMSDYDHLGFVAQYNQFHMRTNYREDTHQVVIGTSYMHSFQTSGDPVIYFGYTRTNDSAIQAKVAYDPNYNNGLTVASHLTNNYILYLQYSIGKDIDVFSGDYVNFRRDTGAFARDAIVVYGKDKTSYISIGLNWRPWSFWTVSGQVASTSNESNISLYSYYKTESRITLKREFQ